MFCLEITHKVIDFDNCLPFIYFLIYKHACSSFVCLFFFFLLSVATNGCLKQTSRNISQGYTHIRYVLLLFPPHISLITLSLLGYHDGDCAAHKSSKPSFLTSKTANES